MNRSEHSIQNSIWGFSYRVLHMILPVFLRAIIIRNIGAEYVGLNGLFKSILSVLNLSELGFGTAIVYMMYKPIAENDQQTICVLLSLLRRIYRWVGLIILVLGCLVFPFLGILVKNDTGADVNIYALYGMYLFHTVTSYLLFSYRSSLFTAHQRSDITFKVLFVCDIIQYAIQIVVLFGTKNYYLYLLVFSLMIIPQNLSYLFISKKKYPDLYCKGTPTKEQMAVVTTKIRALLGHRIGSTVIFSIDDVIISAFLGVSILTQYDNYNYIMSAVVTMLAVILTSILASIGNKMSLDSVNSIYALFKKLTFLWIGLVGWCATCLVSLYQPFISLWVGSQYCFDEGIVICIAFYFFTWQFRQMGLTMKDAAGLWEPDKWKPYIGMVLNLVLSIIFVKITGNVIGVLIPTITVLVLIYFPWETHALFKHYFHTSSKEYLLLVTRYIITAFISITATFLIARLTPNQGILFFALRIIICVLMMPSIYIVLNINSQQTKEALSDFRKLAPRYISKLKKRLPGRN